VRVDNELVLGLAPIVCCKGLDKIYVVLYMCVRVDRAGGGRVDAVVPAQDQAGNDFPTWGRSGGVQRVVLDQCLLSTAVARSAA
jgi:hypothetical protein